MQRHAEQTSEAQADPFVRNGVCAPVVVADNELTIYYESGPLIDDMVADILPAQSRGWLESYIFADDASGAAVVDALVERAMAGLDVRLTIDGWGSLCTPMSLFALLLAAGGKVHLY